MAPNKRRRIVEEGPGHSDCKAKIGLMGSSRAIEGGLELERLTRLAERLGEVIAERGCVLVTGATTGFPDVVSRAARRHGGLTVGISPGLSREEHTTRYSLPDDGVDVLVYTGFGLKGRNVINVRSSDVVIIFGGGIGTLNEFTIAYDEGKSCWGARGHRRRSGSNHGNRGVIKQARWSQTGV